jgi:hypothetical protein
LDTFAFFTETFFGFAGTFALPFLKLIAFFAMAMISSSLTNPILTKLSLSPVSAPRPYPFSSGSLPEF